LALFARFVSGTVQAAPEMYADVWNQNWRAKSKNTFPFVFSIPVLTKYSSNYFVPLSSFFSSSLKGIDKEHDAVQNGHSHRTKKS